MTRWGCQDCHALYGAWLSRCPRCGSVKELEMALSVCTGCTTKYAVGLPKCPHCGSTDHVEDGQPMPKITVHGGPTSVTAGPDEPGYMPPVDEPEAATGGDTVTWVSEPGPELVDLPYGSKVYTSKPEGGEGSSPGTSSSASTAKPPAKTSDSTTSDPGPAPTTANRSRKARAASSSAGSTAGSTPATGPQDKPPADPSDDAEAADDAVDTA